MSLKHGVLLAVLILLAVVPGMFALAQDGEREIEVTAVLETDPSPGDGVFSPVIWLHPTDLTQSVIVGTDDNLGAGVYDLDGNLLQFDDQHGPMGGADLRYNFGSRRIPLIVSAVKDEARMVYYTIEPESRSLVYLGETETGMRLEMVCMYHSPVTDSFYAIAISERGLLEQYALTEDDGVIAASLVRAIDVGGELEGCAVDDAMRRVYVSEGELLVWRYGAEPESGTSRAIVDYVGGHITEEIEGVALYLTSGTDGYLLVSDEKADRVLVYERGGDNEFIGAFAIGATDTVDQVSEPAGFNVVNLPIDERFPQGLFVTNDDSNSNPNADTNFKLVSWGEIAAGLELDLDTAYDPRATDAAAMEGDVANVTALVETEPVAAATDAADDPAIWVHPTDPALSLVIGTDKRNGLIVYNLDGQIIQTLNIGRVNNVDVRNGFMLNDETVSLVTATNRTDNSLVIYAVDDETRQMVDVAAEPVISAVQEVYGLCMYVSPVDGTFYSFVNSSGTGEVEQYALTAQGDLVAAELVRTFVVGSQTEGCVADDEAGMLFIGEEEVGIWKYDAEPGRGEERTMIDSVGEDGNLTADVEGMALYMGMDGAGYLVVSSQGSSEFVLYERGGENAYVGTFSIVQTDTVDGVSGTDGLDVTSAPLGELFPDGLLVVQDDLNINPVSTQNFKLISWADVAAALELPE
ncbi:MAG: phytase [Chloroflexi bacterium]|nr:phytase [Chloroflexota bacterium]